MKLVLLGTGGPFPDPQRHGAAAVVETAAGRILFDAGRGTVLQLVRAGIDVSSIGHVFITHHHYDHIGDLADFMITSWLMGRRDTLRVRGPVGTAAIVSALLEQVYARDIAFRERESVWGRWPPVETTEIDAGAVEETPGWRVVAERMVHGDGLDLGDLGWAALGYRVEAEGKRLAISGDTIACEGLDRLAENADLLLQCCYLAEDELTSPHLRRLARHTLASSGQVGPLAERAGVRTLVLTHFRPKSPELMERLVEDVRREFSGKLVVGEDLMTLTV